MRATASSTHVLGIDPGSRYTGYAVVSSQGSRFTCQSHGLWPLHKEQDEAKMLLRLSTCIGELLKEYPCKEVAIEDAFFGKNAQSTLKLGRIQGVIFLVCAQHQLDTFRYAPRSIKKALTGNGNAQKEAVAQSCRLLVSLPASTVLRSDQSDAIATGLCHLIRST